MPVSPALRIMNYIPAVGFITTKNFYRPALLLIPGGVAGLHTAKMNYDYKKHSTKTKQHY